MATLYSLGAVTIRQYRLHTGDETNGDAECSGVLLEAESLINDELRRFLASDERTGTFSIYPDGRLYPNAYPITAADLMIEGRALVGGTPDGGPFVGVWEPSTSTRSTVTWTGGYNADTLPLTLEHALYDLAAALLAPAPILTGVPGGTTAASVGDVSVTVDPRSGGGVDAYVPGLSDRVRRYQNRFVA